jgi:phosphoethanolamine N-methyltransferase
VTGSLDTNQYAPEKIRSYEAIYGRHFVSPGGEACARECVARLELTPGDTVLDVGSGLGGSAFLMAREYGARVHGIDVSANMIALARDKCREEQLESQVDFTLGDCLELNASQAYQAVYSRDVILHIAQKLRLFETLREALVPGGRLLFTDYCRGEGRPSNAFESYVAERGYHLYTVAGYDEILRTAGFVEVQSEDWTARFIDIHRLELERLPSAGLPADDEAALRQGWREKIARAQRGEQRWGFFTARRARATGETGA